MADTRQRTTLGNWFRFLTRALGLTAALVAAFALVLLGTEFRDNLRDLLSVERLKAISEGASGQLARVGAIVAGVGAAVAVVVLLFELLGLLFFGSGRRTAAGTVSTLGIVAAVVLLLLVNVYSFTHYRRYDCTRDQRFTLPPEITTELSKLRASSPTTIVVLQRHNTFGNLTTKRDSFTSAAERQVTEKVRDLVDQFREFGPQFHVAVLDTEAFEYDRELAELTKDAPELKTAIEAAPENSIFFHANKRVQRLSFNEFMQLDRTASRAADGGNANLVLIPQGIDTFARRILAVHERRPKAAVLVVHEWLTTVATEGQEEFSLAGLKKSLNDQGFDVVDIVLKKNWADNTKDLEPAAYSLEETKLERVEGDADAAREALRSARDDVRILEAVRKAAEEFEKRPWEDRAGFYNSLIEGTRQREWTELIAAFRKWAAGGRPVTEQNESEFRPLLFAGLTAQTRLAQSQVEEAEKDVKQAEAKLKAAYADEGAIEDRRVADVKEKLKRLVADVDLLIVPRYTVVNATIGRSIGATLHRLDRKQIEVVKEFMKSGKSVLACLGPISSGSGPQMEAIDDFEHLLRERGVLLGRETILYDGERKAFAAARAGAILTGAGAEIPPLTLGGKPPADSRLAPNPIASTLRLTGRTAEQSLALQLRAPRPVYLAPGWDQKVPFVAEFLFTPPGAWNEERPFLTTDRVGRVTYIPRYEPTPEDDPKRNSPFEERRAAFPVAVAVESKIPVSWAYEDAPAREADAILAPLSHGPTFALTRAIEQADLPKQRTVVFGSGHLFNGPDLKAPQEQLLLHSVNWLTRREDRLPRPATETNSAWHYPRVAMSERDRHLWRFGTAAGLPLVVAYVGLLVTLRRRMR